MPNLVSAAGTPAAYNFFYIVPEDRPKFIRRLLNLTTDQMNSEAALNIQPIGSSPLLIHKKDLARLAPRWLDLSVAIVRNQEIYAQWGWVSEVRSRHSALCP